METKNLIENIQNPALHIRTLYCEAAKLMVAEGSYNNFLIPSYAGFYTVASQFLKNVKVGFGSGDKDIRFSFFEVGDSRSGKGQRSNHAKNFASLLRLKWCKRTSLNDAGLIGTIDEHAVKYNYEHGLSRLNPRQGRFEYRNPVTIGDMGNYDLIFFDECKQFIMPSSLNKDLLTNLSEGLDCPGHIVKKMKFIDEIDYLSSSSIYATTFNMTQFKDIVINQGFFQRIPMYVMEYSPDETDDMRDKTIDLFNTDPAKKQRYDELMHQIGELMQQINREEHTIYLTPAAVNTLKGCYGRFSPLMHASSGDKLKILKSMGQTLIDVCYKTGCMHAIIRNSLKVEPKDIIMGSPLARSLIDTVANKIEVEQSAMTLNDIQLKRLVSIVSTYNGTLTKSGLSEKLKEVLHFGKNKSTSLINRAIQLNYLEEQNGDGNTKIIRLSQAEA